MHLAYVSPFDPADLRAFAGIPHFVTEALRSKVDRLSVVGPLPMGGAVRGRAAKLAARLRGESYLRSHTWAAVRPMAAEARRQLATLRPDAVLTPSTLPLAALDTDLPTASWCDATFEANLLFYPEFSGLPDDLVIEAHAVERAALHATTVPAFASEFAAQSAAGYYGAPGTAVVPFGANLAVPPDADAVARAIGARSRDVCRLLFVGGGWVRKGGDVALRVAEELVALGVPATLTVAGPRPPVEAHPLLRAEGFLRKDVPAERDRLRQLFAESHVLCMPVRAEDFGCVYAEAAAFGLPSVSSRVGGVPSAVADGVSGILFEGRERPDVIAERIAALWADTERYAALAASARGHYDRVLNWDVGVERMLDLLRPHLR